MFENIDDIKTELEQKSQQLQACDLRIRTIMIKSLRGILIVDMSKTVRFANPAAAAIFGCNAEVLMGTQFDYPLEPDKSAELQIKARDGRTVIVEIWAVETEWDAYQAYFVSLRDITESKLAEDALRFSEARFRALFRDNPVMIVTLSTDLTMVSVNPSCANQLGYTIDELEGQSVLKLIHEDDRLAVAGQLRMCMQNPNQVYRWQFRKVRKDGVLLWVEEIAQAVRDLNGALNILVVCQDITARRRTEKALRKSENKFLTVFHAVPAMLGITTLAEGRFIDVNETCMRILGYQRDEVIGRTSQEIGLWKGQADRDRAMRALEEHGTVRDMEINLRSKTGESFVGLLSAEFIDINGEQYILSMINDITERKRMEEEIERLNTDLAARAAELEAANLELEAANLELETFNYSVAHDLRQPLNAISSYCQIIELKFMRCVAKRSRRINWC